MRFQILHISLQLGQVIGVSSGLKGGELACQALHVGSLSRDRSLKRAGEFGDGPDLALHRADIEAWLLVSELAGAEISPQLRQVGLELLKIFSVFFVI